MFFVPRALLAHLEGLRKRDKNKKNTENTPDIESHSYDSESESEDEIDAENADGAAKAAGKPSADAVRELPEDYYYNIKYHKDAGPFLALYLKFALFASWVVVQDFFNYTVLLVIVLAGILVGVETYDGMEELPEILFLNMFVLAVFVLEMAMKMLAEGLMPHRYFTNSDWKWNWFDATIIVLSLPIWGSLFGGGSIKMLRLIRLTRLGKIVRKIPPLQMIIRGILGGLKSVGYITLLQILVFYIFSVIGYYFFSVNDPFHYGSVPYAMFTLFRLYTLDNWGDFMFVNTYGCNQYMDMYVEDFNMTPFNYMLWCRHPEEYWYGPLFCLVFILVAQMIILSLFIGAVSNSMMDSMEVLQKQREEFIKQQLYEKNKARILNFAKPGTADGSTKTGARATSPLLGDGRATTPLMLKKRRTGFKEHQTDDDGTPVPMETIEDEHGAEQFENLTFEDYFYFYLELGLQYAWMPFQFVINCAQSTYAYIFAIEDAHYRNELSKLFFTAMRYDAHEELRILQKKRRPQAPSSSSFSSFQQSNKVTPASPQASAKKTQDDHQSAAASAAAAVTVDTDAQEANAVLSPQVSVAPSHKYAVREINMSNYKEHMPQNFFEAYSIWAKLSRVIAESKEFNNFVTVTICLAAVDIGFQTDYRIMKYDNIMKIVADTDTFILAVFTAELIFKMCAEEFRPWAYFYSGWNCFDFIIVMSSYFSGAGAILLLLRLLRLLRVLKLVKKLPRLSIIINAFLIAGQSIGWALVLLMLFHYVFGIIGLMLFKANDPHRFGSLHQSMVAVFRLISLDDSSYTAYINAWGCDLYQDIPYVINPHWCSEPSGNPMISFVYYIVLVTIGNQILLSLFIGVLSTSLDQARTNFLKEKEFDEKISEFCNTLYGITPKRIKAFKVAFKLLDIDESDVLDDDKLRLGLAILDGVEAAITDEFNEVEEFNGSTKRRKAVKMSEEEVQYLLRSVDTTGTGVGLHIIGFIKFMCGTPMFVENERVSRVVEQWHKRQKNMSKSDNLTAVLLSGMRSKSGKNLVLHDKRMNYRMRAAVAGIDEYQDVAATAIQLCWLRYKAIKVVEVKRSMSFMSQSGNGSSSATPRKTPFGSKEMLMRGESSNRRTLFNVPDPINESGRPYSPGDALQRSAKAQSNGVMVNGRMIEVPEFIFANDNANYVY